MRIEAYKRQDVLAGLLFLAIALIGLWVARGYVVGSPGQMGKGFFPVVLCSILAVLGAATAVRGFVSSHPERFRLHWRPLLMVVGGFGAFGFSLNRLGFVLAAALMLAVGSLALPGQRVLETILTAVVLIVGCGLLFVVLLRLPIPLWPQF